MRGPETDDLRLRRFRSWPAPLRVVYARPRTFVALATGLVAFAALPASARLVTRLLIAWDVFAALYLVLAYVGAFRNGRAHIRRNAVMQDDGRFLILILTALGAFATLAAIVAELAHAQKDPAALTLATATIALSWAVVHTAFALHYAHEYYRSDPPGGLAFPGDDKPDYWDFVYFALVIGMTAQVSDVGVTDRTIRRTVAAHGVVSFVFNTALVALMVNIAASAI